MTVSQRKNHFQVLYKDEALKTFLSLVPSTVHPPLETKQALKVVYKVWRVLWPFSSGKSEKDLSVWKNSVWVWLCSKVEVNTHRQQCLSMSHRWSPAGRIQESSTPLTAAAGRNSSSWWSNLAVQRCHPLAVCERERDNAEGRQAAVKWIWIICI